MESTTVEVNVDTTSIDKALVKMDRLIQKVEYLKSLMDDINDVEEETELAEKLQKPQIVYSINMGTFMEIANAPHDLFTPEFAERITNDARQIIMPKKKAEKESKIIDLTNSNNYKG